MSTTITIAAADEITVVETSEQTATTIEIANAVSTGGTWGTIAGTLSNQTDLQAALDAKASKAVANTFTEDQTIQKNQSGETSVNITNTDAEANAAVNLTSDTVSAKLITYAPGHFEPTEAGRARIEYTGTAGLQFVNNNDAPIVMTIQGNSLLSLNSTQLDVAAALKLSTLTAGVLKTDADGDVTAGAIAQSDVTSLTSDLALKAPLASPTFTGTVVLPSTTSIGDVSDTEIGYVNGVTSAIQTQIDTKAPTASPTFTGTAVVSGTLHADDEIINAYTALGSVIKAQTVGTWLTNVNAVSTMVDGQIMYTAVYLQKAATLTGVKFWQGTSGVFTGDQFNGLALYTYSGGTLTQVAITANNANIWKSTLNSVASAAFTGTYAAAAGLYFVGLIYSNSAQTTAPTVGLAFTTAQTSIGAVDFTNSAKLNGIQTSQTSLPSSIAMSSITASNLRYWVALY